MNAFHPAEDVDPVGFLGFSSLFDFDIRLIAMLHGMIALRWHQFVWGLKQWARALGLMPASGKWIERISFIYIYVLILAVWGPSALQTFGNLYKSEVLTSAALQVTILQSTLPWIIAVVSVLLIVFPWKAWLLRLNYGDVTYLSPSPFDRRILALWRYLEMIFFVTLIVWLPIAVLAPMFGSIWAADVLTAIFVETLAISLWAALMLAIGWHISLQEYSRTPLSPGFALLARMGILAAAGGIAIWKPELLLLPGRLIVMLGFGGVSWAWLFLLCACVVGVLMVWRAGSHLSLTRASAGSEIFARIEQLGYMAFVNRQVVFSILGEARASQRKAVGILPPAFGLAVIFSRAALHYRRRVGEGLQFFIGGLAFGFLLIFWRPTDIVLIVVTAMLLALLVPPWMSNLFLQDARVAFMSQFIPQSLQRRLLVASVVPVLILLAGMLPVLVVFNVWIPDWGWGIIPVIWVLSLVGHVEVVGRGSTLGQRSVISVMLAAVAIFIVLWSAASSDIGGILAFGQGVMVSGGVSMALLLYAEYRHTGFAAATRV